VCLYSVLYCLPHTPLPPPRPNITISCLNFAVVVLWAQTTTPLAAVWRADVGGMCACGLTAAVALLLVAALVLPTAASKEVSNWGVQDWTGLLSVARMVLPGAQQLTTLVRV
jgi:hypothetical protein